MYENEIYSDSGSRMYATYQAGGAAYNTNGSVGNGNDGGKKKKGILRKIFLSISLGLIFGLFAGAGFYTVQLGTGMLTQTGNQDAVTSDDSKNPRTPDSMVSNDGNPTPNNNVTNVMYMTSDVSQVVEQVMPAMVSIINNTVNSMKIWGYTYTETVPYAGSGIIVGENDTELLIVTNNHVVEKASTLEVTFIDESVAPASIKGLDSDMDLAVIAVPLDSLSAETRSAITIARLGDSDNLKLGTPVIAIGNALGYGQSVTNGIISALSREMTNEDGTTNIFIQTNADINEGNSGGALLTITGEIIGINSAKIKGTGVEGMGYAIPISSASPIIADLMERETRTAKVSDEERGYMGITMQAVTSQYASMFGIPQGISIVSVEDGSPAEQAGLMMHDIIVKFDGQRVYLESELKELVTYYRAGETVTISLQRLVNGQYESMELELTLGNWPQGR